MNALLGLACAVALAELYSGSTTVVDVPYLAPPVRILAIEGYRDGGTIGFELMGSNGVTLAGGFDGRMDHGRAKLPRLLFVGAKHPSMPGARMLAESSSAERELLRLVSRALQDSLPSGVRRRLSRTRSATDLRHPREVGPWQLLLALEHRRRER
jgi:hypothetical protein